MVAIAPLVRRYRFIPERITLHAEELAYLWQRRRASLRSPDITLPDFTYLQERIDAHLQGLLVAGAELAPMLDGFLHGDQRDEAFAAAWALLRPSAMASAKLANSTVNHSHSATAAVKPSGLLAASAVVKALPTYTTNITGLRHCTRGSSFLKASSSAGRTRAGSNRVNVLRVITISVPFI